VHLDDDIVGPQHAAPEGMKSIFAAESERRAGALFAMLDERILAISPCRLRVKNR